MRPERPEGLAEDIEDEAHSFIIEGFWRETGVASDQVVGYNMKLAH